MNVKEIENLNAIELNKQLSKLFLDKNINLRQLKSLLKNGANPNLSLQTLLFPFVSTRKDYSFPLLHIISGKQNSFEMAELLLEHGADLCLVDSAIGNTPLLTAIAMNDEELALYFISIISSHPNVRIRALLDQKDQGIECQNTPLTLALKKRMNNVAIALINAGTDVNLSEKKGLTPLHWAAMLRNNSIIELLLQHKVNISQKSSYGFSAKDYYCYEIRLLDIEYPITELGISKMNYMNMPELTDLFYHVVSGDISASIMNDHLKEIIQIRNKQCLDTNLIEKLVIPGNHNELEKRHQKMAKEQLPRFKYAKVIEDELAWQELYKLRELSLAGETKKIKIEKRQTKEKMSDAISDINESIRPFVANECEELACKQTAEILKTVKESNIEDYYKNLTRENSSGADSIKILITHPLMKLQSLRENKLFSMNKELDKHIAGLEKRAKAITPVCNHAIRLLGFAKFRQIRQDVHAYASTINDTLYYFMPNSVAKKAMTLTASLLADVKNRKSFILILDSFMNENQVILDKQFSHAEIRKQFKDIEEFRNSIRYILGSSLEQLCLLRDNHQEISNLIIELLENNIAIMRIQPMPYQK